MEKMGTTKMTCTRFLKLGYVHMNCNNKAVGYSEDYGYICQECLDELVKSYHHDIVDFMNSEPAKKPWTVEKLKGIFKKC